MERRPPRRRLRSLSVAGTPDPATAPHIARKTRVTGECGVHGKFGRPCPRLARSSRVEARNGPIGTRLVLLHQFGEHERTPEPACELCGEFIGKPVEHHLPRPRLGREPPLGVEPIMQPQLVIHGA